MTNAIYEYDIRRQMKRDASVVWIGARRSGKTFSVKHCLYEMKFKRVIAFTGSAECEEFYESFVPRSYVYGEFNEAKLEEIIAYQLHLKNLRKRDETVDLELGVILDDFGFDDKVMKSKILRFLLMNGRNSGFFVGITVQYGINLPKGLRGNMDVIFIFDERSRDNRIGLYKHYTSCFKTFDQFNEYLDACTQDGKCMVIDNTVKSNKLEDKVFWYQPVFDLPKFIVGDKGSIAFDRIHYRNELDEMYGVDAGPTTTTTKSMSSSSSLESSAISGSTKANKVKMSRKDIMMKTLFETPLDCTQNNLNDDCKTSSRQKRETYPMWSMKSSNSIQLRSRKEDPASTELEIPNHAVIDRQTNQELQNANIHSRVSSIPPENEIFSPSAQDPSLFFPSTPLSAYSPYSGININHGMDMPFPTPQSSPIDLYQMHALMNMMTSPQSNNHHHTNLPQTPDPQQQQQQQQQQAAYDQWMQQYQSMAMAQYMAQNPNYIPQPQREYETYEAYQQQLAGIMPNGYEMNPSTFINVS